MCEIYIKKTWIPNPHIVVDSEACHDVRIKVQRCEHYTSHEEKITQQFPLQFVSGGPGSGNDWIRWMASLNS